MDENNTICSIVGVNISEGDAVTLLGRLGASLKDQIDISESGSHKSRTGRDNYERFAQDLQEDTTYLQSTGSDGIRYVISAALAAAINPAAYKVELPDALKGFEGFDVRTIPASTPPFWKFWEKSKPEERRYIPNDRGKYAVAALLYLSLQGVAMDERFSWLDPNTKQVKDPRQVMGPRQVMEELGEALQKLTKAHPNYALPGYAPNTK